MFTKTPPNAPLYFASAGCLLNVNPLQCYQTRRREPSCTFVDRSSLRCDCISSQSFSSSGSKNLINLLFSNPGLAKLGLNKNAKIAIFGSGESHKRELMWLVNMQDVIVYICGGATRTIVGVHFQFIFLKFIKYIFFISIKGLQWKGLFWRNLHRKPTSKCI